MQMTSQEAFVETLRVQGVKLAFGIVGSAYMPGLDVFERAGIRFVDVAHEQGAAHMADGYTRVGGEIAVCIAQKRSGHHQLRDRGRRRLLEPHPDGGDHTGDRLQHPGSRRFSGDAPASLL